jgi:hypothetical protein
MYRAHLFRASGSQCDGPRHEDGLSACGNDEGGWQILVIAARSNNAAGFAQLGFVFFQRAVGDHIGGAEALVQIDEQLFEQLLVHVPRALQPFRGHARDRRSSRGCGCRESASARLKPVRPLPADCGQGNGCRGRRLCGGLAARRRHTPEPYFAGGGGGGRSFGGVMSKRCLPECGSIDRS